MYEHTYGGRDPNLRAADSDREAIAERLRRSQAEGRLDVQEFQDRLDQCYKAKTIGELEQLMADLPPERRPEERVRPRRVPLVPLVPILIAVLLISAAAGHHGHFGFWILIPLFFLAKFWRWRRWPWSMLRGRHRGEPSV
jgi:hypothetical protein